MYMNCEKQRMKCCQYAAVYFISYYLESLEAIQWVEEGGVELRQLQLSSNEFSCGVQVKANLKI